MTPAEKVSSRTNTFEVLAFKTGNPRQPGKCNPAPSQSRIATCRYVAVHERSTTSLLPGPASGIWIRAWIRDDRDYSRSRDGDGGRHGWIPDHPVGRVGWSASIERHHGSGRSPCCLTWAARCPTTCSPRRSVSPPSGAPQLPRVLTARAERTRRGVDVSRRPADHDRVVVGPRRRRHAGLTLTPGDASHRDVDPERLVERGDVVLE